MRSRPVASLAALTEAVSSTEVEEIVVAKDLSGVPGFQLRPGQSLIGGGDEDVKISFLQGVDGVCCTRDNAIRRIHLQTSRQHRAVFNEYSFDSFGRLSLHDVTTIGSVQIIARDRVKGGHVEVLGLRVSDADTTSYSERPHAFGVSVLQGAFTLWNMQEDVRSSVTATLDHIAIGVQGQPVAGTGVFVSGGGDDRGSVDVDVLRTGPVFSNGLIPQGTPDLISGGVFVLYGAKVDFVENTGVVETMGSNDMALDNWGTVNHWIARAPITTHASSAIGFVNFGRLNDLRVNATIETHGTGARGFNVYAGTVSHAEFDRIVTHGDGSVGIQISQPVGRVVVDRGIETFGAAGPSLVKGVVTQLSAVGVSVKSGGQIQELTIRGGLITHGQDIAPLEQAGVIQSLSIRGGMQNVATDRIA